MYIVWSCNSEQIISTIHKLLHTAEKPSRPKVTASGVKQSECKVCEDILLIKLLLTAHKYIHRGGKPYDYNVC